MMTPKTIVNRYPLYMKLRRNPQYVRMDVQIDHEVVETLKCDLCGKPMEYEGYAKNLDWGLIYKHAFALCFECSYAVSF